MDIDGECEYTATKSVQQYLSLKKQELEAEGKEENNDNNNNK